MEKNGQLHSPTAFTSANMYRRLGGGGLRGVMGLVKKQA
jgi:hypothetical protein